uniref:MFS domain-containing protein n=1 Tax=Elaeophora elaphi TaxID=1147741 RepID=A0A0R3S322_9BILA
LILSLFIVFTFSALTSSLESQHKCLGNKRISFGLKFRDSKTDESYTSTDEDNDSNVVYVKQRLLRSSQQHRTVIKRKSNEVTSRNIFLALSFIALGISTSIQSITMPNVIVSVHASSSLFAVFALSITAFGFLVGCSTGGLVILCGNDFGTRAIFAMHAFFAAGIFLMSLLSTFILSGAAVPYSRFSKLPVDHNVFNRLLIKREMNLLAVQSSGDIFVKSNALKESTTSKSLRQPDHVVGVESVAEPKTLENVQRRKEAVGHIKSKEEGRDVVKNGFLHDNGAEEYSQSQNKFTHSSNARPAGTSVSTASSFLRLEKNDDGNIRSMSQIGATIINKNFTTSTPHSLIRSNNFTANFIFNDVSYSFTELNWNMGTVMRNSFWMLEDLKQKLQAATNQFTDWNKAVSWRVYSVLFFLLTGGIESVVGESLTFYALFRPELSLSQRNGLFLTSTFWLGIVTARTKFINIGRLSNFVLFSAAVAGYVAASARSLPTMLCTVFILGLSLGPLSPFLFCWLDEQDLSSRLSLIVCISLFFAYIILIMTVRTARVIVRLSAINQCSSGQSSEVSVKTSVQSKIRNGDYMVLVDKSDGKSDVSVDSDSFA